MTDKWNTDMKARGEKLGRARVDHLTSQLSTSLADDLPDHIDVRQDGDNVIVSGPNLSSQLEDNSSLSDIGFLLQGVR